MNQYDSNSDVEYSVSRRCSGSVHAFGWQSPIPTTNEIPSLSLSITRIAVDCPFGSQKCDYSIDKSQRGLLLITAHRRHTFKSDYLLLSNKHDTVFQAFTIPYDADVDNMKPYIERHTNRLIIEIPRISSSYIHITGTSNDLTNSSNIISTSPSHFIYDNIKHNKKYSSNNRHKLEYRVDCRGYTADELGVFIQDQNLIVQGNTGRTKSGDTGQKHVSKKFSRRIPLPDKVDLTKVVSYLKNGELLIEAPLKREIYYDDDDELTTVPNRMAMKFNRTRSPIPDSRQRRYRRREHVSRHRQHDYQDNRQALKPLQQTHSCENLRYPFYRSFQDNDDDDDDDDDEERTNRHRRIVNYERHVINCNDTTQHPTQRYIQSPTSNVVTTTTTHRSYPTDNDIYFKY